MKCCWIPGMGFPKSLLGIRMCKVNLISPKLFLLFSKHSTTRMSLHVKWSYSKQNHTHVQLTCKALRRAKRMWKIRWLFLMMVARPNPQVRPNRGVKMATLLPIWNKEFLSCLFDLSPIVGLIIFIITTAVMNKFIATMIRAGMTKAKRALLSFQLSQQTSFLV